MYLTLGHHKFFLRGKSTIVDSYKESLSTELFQKSKPYDLSPL